MSRALDERAKKAKSDGEELERLMAEYRPFILGRVYNHGFGDRDDAVSVALAAFFEAVRSYSMEKGAFLSYAGKVIHSRLLDARRREARHRGRSVSVEAVGEAIDQSRFAAMQREILERREACRDEIEEFTGELKRWGVKLSDVAASAPRHELTRRICAKALQHMAEDAAMASKLNLNKRLPLTELARQLGVSVKVLERHRRYLVAAWVIRQGDYAILREYIPALGKEAEKSS